MVSAVSPHYRWRRSNGHVLRPLPIYLEVVATNSPLLNLQSDMISDGRLLPIRTASFGFVLGRFAKAHRRTFSSKPSSGRNDGNRRCDCGVTMLVWHVARPFRRGGCPHSP